VDVGYLPNHAKYCLSVLSLQWANIRTSPIGIPNNWYQNIWFKVVFDFCSKIKMVKIVFWPYQCVEEEETKLLMKTTSKSDVGNVLTRRHCRWSCWPRAQTRATRHTRLLRPDGLTRPECQTTWPMCQTRIRMTSPWRQHAQLACHVSVQSASTSSNWDPPDTSADTSRAELESSREPRDMIQCSGSYVQPDLWLNLGRSLGQHCFDQILAVWNAIWTISDLFLANLIVPDAMVQSYHWYLRPKVVVVS
jgi:hypothetical protein